MLEKTNIMRGPFLREEVPLWKDADPGVAEVEDVIKRLERINASKTVSWLPGEGVSQNFG